MKLFFHYHFLVLKTKESDGMCVFVSIYFPTSFRRGKNYTPVLLSQLLEHSLLFLDCFAFARITINQEYHNSLIFTLTLKDVPQGKSQYLQQKQQHFFVVIVHSSQHSSTPQCFKIFFHSQ